MGVERITKIIMQRDELTQEEAEELVEETRQAILDDPDEGVEIIYEYLGLEIDYIIDLIL